MILFTEEAIFASSISKFGKSFRYTDRDDFRSSKESAISTSLIHNMSSDRKIRTGSHLISESYLPAQKRWKSREFVNLKFRYLLSLMSKHRTLWNNHRKGSHGRRLFCKCRHWDCASDSFFISCDKCPYANTHPIRTCGIWCRKWMNSLIRCL